MNDDLPFYTALIVEDNPNHRKTLCDALYNSAKIKWDVVCYEGSFAADDVRWWVEDHISYGSVLSTICFLDLVWIGPGDADPRQTAWTKQNEFLRVLLTPHTKRFADGPGGVDGLAVLPTLRRVPFLQVVVHSTFGSNGLRTFVAELGAVATIQKLPFSTPGTRGAIATYEQTVGQLVSALSADWGEKCDTLSFSNWLAAPSDDSCLAELRQRLNLEKDEDASNAKLLSAEALRLQLADLEDGLIRGRSGKKLLSPQLPPRVMRLPKDILAKQSFSRRVNELARILKAAEQSNKTLVVVGGCPIERKSLFEFAASKAAIDNSWLVFECHIPEGVPKFTARNRHEVSHHWIVLRGLSQLHDSNRLEVAHWLNGVAHVHGGRTRPWRVLVVVDELAPHLREFLRTVQGDWQEYVLRPLNERADELADYASCLWQLHLRSEITAEEAKMLNTIPFPTLTRLEQSIKATSEDPKRKLAIPGDVVIKNKQPKTKQEFLALIEAVGLTIEHSQQMIGDALGVKKASISMWAKKLGMRVGKVDKNVVKLTTKMPEKKGK